MILLSEASYLWMLTLQFLKFNGNLGCVELPLWLMYFYSVSGCVQAVSLPDIYLFDEIFRAGTVRAATIEEIEAEKSVIEKDAVSIG